MESVKRMTTSTYIEMAKQTENLARLFEKYDVSLSADLEKMIGSAKKLAEKWSAGQISEITQKEVWETVAIERITKPVFNLDGHQRANEILKKLARGSISMLEHERTIARDTFWEIEVWNTLRGAGLDSDLIDPPDVVWKEEGELTGIACKRIYSERHIQNVLSEAVAQIEKTTGFGVAAFQLEDARIPKGKMLKTTTNEEAAKALQEINQTFFDEHRRHFLKYFSKDRLTGALASCSSLSKIEMPSINTQWCVWTHPDLSAEHRERIYRLYRAISGDTS